MKPSNIVSSLIVAIKAKRPVFIWGAPGVGKYRPPRNHPDVKRDRLNKRGMKKLRKLKNYPDHELYLMVASRAEILVRVILMPWKWGLNLISPSTKGAAKEVERWQFIAEERYGKVRHLVLQRNVERDIWRIK